MATLYNQQRVLGIRIVADGTLMHNGLPVIGVVDAGGATFLENDLVLGVEALPADKAIHNEQPVRGAVVINDGRVLYNNQPVIPVTEVGSGVLE